MTKTVKVKLDKKTEEYYNIVRRHLKPEGLDEMLFQLGLVYAVKELAWKKAAADDLKVLRDEKKA